MLILDLFSLSKNDIVPFRGYGFKKVKGVFCGFFHTFGVFALAFSVCTEKLDIPA